MAVLKRVFGSALILVTAVFFVSGCSKSDIDTVKESFFAEDKTQNIGKFLETYKNVSGGKWKTIKDDRSRDVVVFYGNYSNKEVAKIFLKDASLTSFADKFADFLDKNKFSLSFSVNFLMSADKNSNTPFVINALGLSSDGSGSNDKQNIDSGVKAVVGNDSFDSLLSKEDSVLLNYYFQKFVADELILSHNKNAQAVPLSFDFDFTDLPGMLFSSIQAGDDPLVDYYPIERIEFSEVKSDDALKSVTYTVKASLTSAYFEALYGKDVGRNGEHGFSLDCNKFDALNAKYEILAAKDLTFVKTVAVPAHDFTILSQCFDLNGFNIGSGQNGFQIFLDNDGAHFSCSSSYPENVAVKAFKKQQELLYRVDNEVKISLLQNAFIGAITGKKLSDKELHEEMVKGREKIYKEKGWTLPPSLFASAVPEVI